MATSVNKPKRNLNTLRTIMTRRASMAIAEEALIALSSDTDEENVDSAQTPNTEPSEIVSGNNGDTINTSQCLYTEGPKHTETSDENAMNSSLLYPKTPLIFGTGEITLLSLSQHLESIEEEGTFQGINGIPRMHDKAVPYENLKSLMYAELKNQSRMLNEIVMAITDLPDFCRTLIAEWHEGSNKMDTREEMYQKSSSHNPEPESKEAYKPDDTSVTSELSVPPKKKDPPDLSVTSKEN